jgi:hypothetical protein
MVYPEALNAPEPNHAGAKSGCPRSLLDINDVIFHAANFSLGLSPALDANRTSISKLN